MDLFTHVYAETTAQLREQRDLLRAELAAEQETEPEEDTVR
jgi:pyruvate dehydrogenase E1 component alpha subunit